MIQLDPNRIAKLALAIQGGEFKAFSFVEPAGYFPPVGHPRACEYFFTVVMHQYGFWNLDKDRWSGSMYGVIDGVTLKGSDFVWRSATKALMAGEENLTRFLDDGGICPLPMADTHHAISRHPIDSKKIIDDANANERPLKRLLEILDHVPGYSGDPFRKKSMLLALALANRPEHFLRTCGEHADAEGWAPVVDYHIQRTALRAGLVVPLDQPLRKKLIERTLLEAHEEQAVRAATFQAMKELSAISGRSDAALDYLFFQARFRCPEAGEPDCPHCPFEPACAKEKELFQPVFRTTAY